MAPNLDEMQEKAFNERPLTFEKSVVDDELLDNFFSGKLPYETKHMEKCVQKICENYKLVYDEQISISANKQALIRDLKEAERRLKDDKSKNFYCIYGEGYYLWLLFYFVRTSQDGFVVFYKNPSGCSMSEDIENKLKEIFKQPVTIVTNCRNDVERDNDNYYGPLTLRNLAKILHMGWTDESIIKKFETFSFVTPEDVCREKFLIATKMAEELGKNTKFIEQLRDFANKIPGKSKEKIDAYAKLVGDLGNEKTEDTVNLEDLKNCRKKILDDKEIKQLQEYHKKLCVTKKEKNSDDPVITDFKPEIQRNYEHEMKQLTIMFKIVDGCKLHYKKLKHYLIPIQTSLKMTEKELEALYAAGEKLENCQDENKKGNGKLIGEGWKKSEKKDPDELSLEEILKEVVIGMDPAENQPKASQEDLDRLKNIVKDVGDETTKWAKKSAEDVRIWAKSKKGCLEQGEKEVVNALAVMNRALGLTQTINMRETQLVAIAIVLFLNKTDKTGRLCQVKTGEGKTVIVSILAAIRCLQGYKVDVITSNIVLADEGVKESEGFFKLMGIDAKVNKESSSYEADVLYGTISKLQFDYLRDLTEGTTIRKHRRLEQVILDEVDSMLVDNGGNIAKISSSFPGMECLRYIYIKIWKELHKARESYAKDAKRLIAEFEKKYENADPADFHKNYREKLDTILNEEKREIRKKLNEIDPCDYPLIPNHLKEYCKSKKQTWIDNAINALYDCHENQQYRICEPYKDAGENIVAPVDFSNTGVTLTNTVWSNGLHQFVQLKHNVELTFESLTGSFISNVGYINLYPNHLLFGLTGTLGSTNEQKLLKGIYDVDFAKVPTYKKKNFNETQSFVVEDSSWDINVVNQVKEIVKDGRPILVICQTLKDLYLIKERLEKFKNTVGYSKLRIFDDENKAKFVIPEMLIKKEVVLSTNLAGRGTNLKLLPEAEKKGGLHVCVTFLPCNMRVEEQAFGRTSRQGHAGTANLIVRQSELKEFNIPLDSNFDTIKIKRNQLEQERIANIEAELVPELNFKDRIFKHFSQFCVDLKEENKTDLTFKIYMKDLKEWWAFWLDKQDFKGKDLQKKDPQTEFERFKKTDQVKGIIMKEISHNPQYCLQLADRYRNQHKLNEAKECLKRALKLEPEHGIAGAYMKLFEVTVESSNQFLEKCKDVVKSVFGMDTKKDECKGEVEDYLKKANNLINMEIKHNEVCLNVNSSEFKNILHISPENSFFKHLHSRTASIQVHKENIEAILKDQTSMFENFDFDAKVETNMRKFGKALKLDKVDNYFTDTEAKELHGIGLDTIFSLREIHLPEAKFFRDALAFIASGIACLVIGLLWLPSWPVMGSLAGTLISEGIVDIVTKVIIENSEKFDEVNYLLGKFLVIGKALLSFGIGPMIQCANLLRKAVEFCRTVQKFINDCKHFIDVCKSIKATLDKIINFLEKQLDKLEFTKLPDKVKKETLKKLDEKSDDYKQLKQIDGVAQQSRKALATDFVKDVGENIAKQLAVSITKDFAIKPFIKHAMKNGVKKAIKKIFVDDFTSCTDLKKKLKKASNLDYTACVNNYVNSQMQILNADVNFGPKAVEFYRTHVDNSDSVVENVSEFARLVQDFANLMKDVGVIATYSKGARKHLLSNLKDSSSDNNVDAVIDEISSNLAQPVIDIIMKAWNDANNV